MSEQPLKKDAQQTTKKSKNAPLIIGLSIGGVLLVGLLIAAVIQAVSAVSPFFSAIGTSVEKNSNYDQRVAALDNQNKTFALGQTMQYGPIDITATSATQQDQPSQAELDYIAKQYTPKKLDFQNAEQYYGLDIQDPQYVRVTVKVQYDAARSDSQTYPTLDGQWGSYLDSVMLDGRAPVVYYVDGALRQPGVLDYKDVNALQAGTPFEFQYLYLAPKTGAQGQLSAIQRAYTKVSSLVGTEGMPVKQYTYTLQLW